MTYPLVVDPLHELEPLGFVDELSANGRSLLAQRLRWHEVEPRTPLIARGDTVGGVYIVQRGALRIFYIGPQGREGTLYWVEPGDACVLALNCVCAELEYPAWAESEAEPSRIGMIPAATFRALFTSEPAIRAYTFRVLSHRVFELMRILEEAATFGLEQRVAALLLERAGSGDTIAMSQERMASHLGSAREVVSRLVRSLAHRGCIETGRGRITIRDRAALRALVADGGA